MWFVCPPACVLILRRPRSRPPQPSCLGHGVLQVIAATNRIDILDPALLRSGRLDRKIEFPNPTEEARARIMQIHSRKMNVKCVLALIPVQAVAVAGRWLTVIEIAFFFPLESDFTPCRWPNSNPYLHCPCSADVNFQELARCTDDFNGAQCKAVCVEAGMIALRRECTEIMHEDYMEGEEADACNHADFM